MDDLGDGFTWKCADKTVARWSELRWAEVFEHGEWHREPTEAVDLATTQVQFGRCLSGLHVRVFGYGQTTTLLAEGELWSLEQSVIEGRSFMGPTVGTGSTVARIRGIPDATEALAARHVFAVLPVAPAGAYVGTGEITTDPIADAVRVAFDNGGVTYAYG